jgi:hypothetical protein
MLSGLRFEAAAATPTVSPNRADVACFVGHVSRRTDVPLPAAIIEQLRAAAWIDGPWRRQLMGVDVLRDDVDALLQVPVVIDAWETFDRLFAWEQRPLSADSSVQCTSYLGAAVRSYFANGGRRAVIVRVGDPWPYLDDDRAAQRDARLAALVPAGTLEPDDPASWRGIQHLYGLGEVSHLCLPDLADACAAEAPAVDVSTPPVPAPEVFVECSAREPAVADDLALRLLDPPRLDGAGFEAWVRQVDAVRRLLATHRRDALLIAAVPLAQSQADSDGAHAQRDWPRFLGEAGVLEPVGSDATGWIHAPSAFVQLVWPWLWTTRSEDLPHRLEPPDGLLCGVLARNALNRGTYRSIAGSVLADVIALDPMPSIDNGVDSLAARLSQRVCLIGPEPEGLMLLSDVTSSLDPAWRGGGVSRLMATLLRTARRVGEAEMFEANGEDLWLRVRRSLETLLDDWWRAGALGGANPAEAYEVRCGRDTMSQNDLDNGRVRVEVSILPAAAVERITVVFDLAAAGSTGVMRGVA